jgi:pimeloyl-ACP methyl ester carboxylesterase
MIIQEKQILINDQTTNYKTIGQGSDVLILHGWGHDSSHWETVAKLIANAGFRVIIPDLIGFGKSQTLITPWTLEDYKNFVLNFCKQLNISQVFLIGHSFGGRISILLASQQSDLTIKKLILCGTAGLYKKQSTKFKIAKVFTDTFGKVLEILHLTELKQQLGDWWAKTVNSDYKKANIILRQTLLNIQKETLFDKIEHIKAPTKIIWGRLDSITPLESADYLHKNIAGSQLTVFENGNHSPHVYMPNEMAKEIIMFLK